MRNLITLNKGRFKPSSTFHPDLELYASSFDILSDSITCVLGSSDLGVIEVQQYMKDGSLNILATFNLERFNDKLLCFTHFSDINQITFVFEQGDVIIAKYNVTVNGDFESTIEIVGSFDSGISAAEWSYDEESLCIVTADDNIVLLSRQFEPISEIRLDKEDLKVSKCVNVGWGKKETQFRGQGTRAMEREALKSLKASGLIGEELRDPTMPYTIDSGHITMMDNKGAEISWRGDCEYFAVSTVDTVNDPNNPEETIERRVLRVYNRDGILDSVSEPVDGMEQNIAWKPQGSLIACVQRNIRVIGEESLDLIFFERNGLRHGSFGTRLSPNEPIKSISWNSSSEILSIILHNRIQLWTSKNYHWFLKQEIYADKITFAKWHPEKELTLIYGDGDSVNILDFTYKMTKGPIIEPFDNGTSLVIDGRMVNITPFGVANVPPPIYFRDFETPDNVIDVATSLSNEVYAALNKDELIFATVTSFEELKKGSSPVVISSLPKTEFATGSDSLRQVAFINDTIVGILLDSDNLSRIALINIENISQPTILTTVDPSDKVVLLSTEFDYNYLVYETRDGKIFQLDAEGQVIEVTQFPELVRDFRVKRVESAIAQTDWGTEPLRLMAFGITFDGKLFANDVLLTNAVTSLEITDSFLLFTTAQHNLQFVHLNTTQFKRLPKVEDETNDERVRSIERGSTLVNVIPSKFSVVLQALRGNLETIYPRIMILSGVRKYILLKQYSDAFSICRIHRVNLDILHDYAPDLFFDNIEHFINELKKVDYINLFISTLSEKNSSDTKYKETLYLDPDQQFNINPPLPTEMELYMEKKLFNPKTSKVNKICQAIVEFLLHNLNYKKKYLQSIITAYACQTPPQLKNALTLIGTLEDKSERESLITYICFLQDVNVVYKNALSLYDVRLALDIAQKSQMDPKEYLPFLQNLYDQAPLRRKFLIDDYLNFYEKALDHLAELDKEVLTVSETFINYVEKHGLYKYALSIFQYQEDKQNSIYHIYAQFLSGKQEYTEAGVIYEMLGDLKQSMESYTLGKKWHEALSIATNHFPDEIQEIAEQLVSSLTIAHKYTDAAQIELKFLRNINESVSLYCKAYRYEEACLTAMLEKKPNLIEEIIDPALGEGFGTIAELLADCKSQVTSQLMRLRELRQKKENDPYAFYGQELDQTDDVSIAPSETSTRESFFTRYTGKTSGTAKTGVSRRTAKNKRREERKRARGKKGTIYEEEYLIQSITRLINRLEQTQPDAVSLINGLMRRNRRKQAYQIQKNFIDLISYLKDNVEEIYKVSEKDRERINEDGQVYYIPEIPVPNIKEFPKKEMLDF